jgi:hypothetical protein
MFSIIFTH